MLLFVPVERTTAASTVATIPEIAVSHAAKAAVDGASANLQNVHHQTCPRRLLSSRCSGGPQTRRLLSLGLLVLLLRVPLQCSVDVLKLVVFVHFFKSNSTREGSK